MNRVGAVTVASEMVSIETDGGGFSKSCMRS